MYLEYENHPKENKSVKFTLYVKKMSSAVLDSKIKALKRKLSEMSYKGEWVEAKVKAGDPSMILRILHFIIVEYNPDIVTWAADKGYTLLSSSDLDFGKQVYRLLNEKYSYRPKLPFEKLFGKGFQQLKVELCIESANLVKG